MKQALAICVVAALGAALCVSAAESASHWIEPAYADAASDAAEPAFLEGGAKARIRGISHTVAPKKGMVTYISPARKVQSSGIVLTPPPVMSVVSATPAVYVQPVVYPHAEYHGVRRSHLPYLTVDDYGTNHDDVVEHVYAAHHHHHHHHLPHHHLHGHGHRHQRVHPVWDSAHHRHRHHRHHHHAHHHVHVVPAHTTGHAHHYGGNPVGVPAALFTEPYHQPHYSHRSPISQGPILVPHGPAGAIALEDPAYTGYNPGPAIQLNSVPTGYYSDGTPYRATINQGYSP